MYALTSYQMSILFCIFVFHLRLPLVVYLFFALFIAVALHFFVYFPPTMCEELFSHSKVRLCTDRITIVRKHCEETKKKNVIIKIDTEYETASSSTIIMKQFEWTHCLSLWTVLNKRWFPFSLFTAKFLSSDVKGWRFEKKREKNDAKNLHKKLQLLLVTNDEWFLIIIFKLPNGKKLTTSLAFKAKENIVKMAISMHFCFSSLLTIFSLLLWKNCILRMPKRMRGAWTSRKS